MKNILLTFIYLSISFHSYSQNKLSGVITNDKGEVLPFATVFIKELNTGTTSNIDGYYEYQLAQGQYAITFQYVGYEAVTRQVSITGNKKLDISLKPQVIMLQGVEVYAGKEDPAYTIMRKAIAKAKYHKQQIDRYTAEVYLKGTFRLVKSPFYVRKMLEKEGVTEDRTFITESVNEVEYIRPNEYNEVVKSVYTTGDDEGISVSPMQFVNGSFYDPEIAEAVSPLSPAAFSYYRFQYDGTFREGNYEISKIKVIPRSKGDKVFTGDLFIVEDYWSIYSLTLETSLAGIIFGVNQVYKPIKENAWLPVTHEFNIEGKVLGFGFEGQYLAAVSQYDITLNPELDLDIEVVDEKVEKELAETLKDQFKNESNKETLEMLESGKEVTRKQLNKIIREYEKNERQESDEPEVVSVTTFKVDSMAYKRDSSYWAQVRPVPLSKDEIKGYEITDSLAVVEKNERKGDTLNVKKDRAKFQPLHLITGARYRMAKGHFEIQSLKSQYNTVDGFNMDYTFGYDRTFEKGNWIEIEPTLRYAFSRETFSGFLTTKYGFGDRKTRNNLTFRAGRYIQQFNADEPIAPIVNTLASLMMERNYMKIFERDFVEGIYTKRVNPKLFIRLKADFSHRRQLFNTTDYRFWDVSGDRFTMNAPVNQDLPDTSFPAHQALTGEVSLTYEPIVKFRMYNGKRYKIDANSPKFTFTYKKGLPDVLDSDVDYDFVSLASSYDFNIGIRGLVNVRAEAGTFLNNESMYFMDYKHFIGNRLPVVTADPINSFRLLDYYNRSTQDEYVALNLHYQFRKFLVTQIPIVRLTGVREGFFVNHLATSNLKPYTELGFGINYIFRVLRVEAVTSFFEGQYQDFGIRIGVATNLDDLF